jgi:hypothetical protein
MTNAEGDLFSQGFKKGGCFLPQIVAEVHVVHPGADEISGIQDASNLL